MVSSVEKSIIHDENINVGRNTWEVKKICLLQYNRSKIDNRLLQYMRSKR